MSSLESPINLKVHLKNERFPKVDYGLKDVYGHIFYIRVKYSFFVLIKAFVL